jgi:hypothetical protein
MQNLLILFVVLFIIVVFLEVSLKIFYPQQTLKDLQESSRKIFIEHDYLPFSLKPNSEDIHITKEFDTNIKINSRGFRNQEFSLEKDTNITRIMVFGDSFTLGHGVEEDETYSAFLEDMFGKERVEVINAGYKAAMSPDSYYLFLKNEISKYKPDIVIFGIWVGNDLTDIDDNEWLEVDDKGLPLNIESKLYYLDESNRLRNKNFIDDGSLYRTVGNFLWKYSQTYNLIRNKFSFLLIKVRKSVQDDFDCIYCNEFDKKHEGTWKKMELIMKASKDISDSNNFNIIVTIFPTREQVDIKEWEKYKSFHKDLEMVMERPQTEFKEILDSLDIMYIDLLPDFQRLNIDNSFYFEKDPHWNVNGHDLVARKLYDYITDSKII